MGYANVAPFNAFEDALEGVAGLMRRLGHLRPQLHKSRGDSEAEAQRLNTRFAGLLDSMKAVSNDNAQDGVLSAAKAGGLLDFHKDLALFVGNIEAHLGAAV